MMGLGFLLMLLLIVIPLVHLGINEQAVKRPAPCLNQMAYVGDLGVIIDFFPDMANKY